MKNDGLLCWNCRKVVSYSVENRKRVRTIGGKQYEYTEKFGRCAVCHEEISVPGLDDENEIILDRLYRADNDLITVDEINEILSKYNIEKRPLSHLLGLGEHTISRYIDGALPNKKYSDLLRDVLADHRLMRKYLNSNKNNITGTAYRKADAAVSGIEEMCSYNSKLELIALYIIHKTVEVTDLSLQKILYYVKAFSWLLLNRDIIDDDCEAWAFGPVFPEIYNKYKKLGNNVISDYDKSIDYHHMLAKDELETLDFVISCFGIYNGGMLMRITHKERPWMEARAGIPEYAPSNIVINNDTIHEYFEEMHKKYNLKSYDGVSKYIRSIGAV